MNFIKPNWFEVSLIFLLTFFKIGPLRFLWNILISWILHFNISFKRLKRTKIVEIVEPVFRASSRVPNLLRPKIGNTRTIPQTGRTFHGVSRPLTTPFYVAHKKIPNAKYPKPNQNPNPKLLAKVLTFILDIEDQLQRRQSIPGNFHQKDSFWVFDKFLEDFWRHLSLSYNEKWNLVITPLTKFLFHDMNTVQNTPLKHRKIQLMHILTRNHSKKSFRVKTHPTKLNCLGNSGRHLRGASWTYATPKN